jgi:hypothetical protein
MKKLTVTVLPVMLFMAALSTNAQKLPTIQPTAGLRVPANIKVDGKATEWDNKFQAYNNHVDFYYTLSNDDDKLYLTVKATEPAIIRRIANGAITLTINTAGQNNAKGAATITFPVFEPKNRFTAVFKESMNARTNSLSDSIINLNNTRFSAKAKMIRTTGIPNVDSLVSVYNSDGIKAAATFDNKMAYTYELSILLKPLGLSVTDLSKFNYQLRINETETRGVTIMTADGPTTDINTDPSKITSISITKPDSQMGQPATDFWGEYTLAK